jgi:hypothetical protein
VVVGVPARFRRWRVPEALIAPLLAIAWWDWDRSTLLARHETLNLPVADFVARWATPSASAR